MRPRSAEQATDTARMAPGLNMRRSSPPLPSHDMTACPASPPPLPALHLHLARPLTCTFALCPRPASMSWMSSAAILPRTRLMSLAWGWRQARRAATAACAKGCGWGAPPRFWSCSMLMLVMHSDAASAAGQEATHTSWLCVRGGGGGDSLPALAGAGAACPLLPPQPARLTAQCHATPFLPTTTQALAQASSSRSHSHRRRSSRRRSRHHHHHHRQHAPCGSARG